jgi:hypothetical protein
MQWGSSVYVDTRAWGLRLIYERHFKIPCPFGLGCKIDGRFVINDILLLQVLQWFMLQRKWKWLIHLLFSDIHPLPPTHIISKKLTNGTLFVTRYQSRYLVCLNYNRM